MHSSDLFDLLSPFSNANPIVIQQFIQAAVRVISEKLFLPEKHYKNCNKLTHFANWIMHWNNFLYYANINKNTQVIPPFIMHAMINNTAYHIQDLYNFL